MKNLKLNRPKLSCISPKCKKLLDLDKKEEYVDTLDEFFEAWITNPQSDGTPAHKRANYLTRYKQLREFFSELKNVTKTSQLIKIE
jgi:hypothetical protein